MLIINQNLHKKPESAENYAISGSKTLCRKLGEEKKFFTIVLTMNFILSTHFKSLSRILNKLIFIYYSNLKFSVNWINARKGI